MRKLILILLVATSLKIEAQTNITGAIKSSNTTNGQFAIIDANGNVASSPDLAGKTINNITFGGTTTFNSNPTFLNSSNIIFQNIIVRSNISIGQGGPGQVLLNIAPFGSGQGTNLMEVLGNVSLTDLAAINSNCVYTTTQGFWTKNTNTFPVASTGWTNTNQFNCVMYITSATAATFTYSDGTNSIFTDTGLTFTTSETLIMHPSYKVTVASGTIVGTAIAQ